MKKICIVQLTRLGDLIQTLQAVMPIKNERNDISLHLVARKKFAEPLDFLLKEYFSEITYLETSEIVKENLSDTVNEADALVKNLSDSKFDILINLSFSKSSSYLCTLIDAKFKLGLFRNQLGEVSIMDNWSQYLFSSVMSGTNNPYSLVEIYKNIIGTNQYLFNTEFDFSSKKHKRISLHPFASDYKKAWTHHKWAELIFSLHKLNPDFTFTIFGSSSDQSDCKKILDLKILENVKIENLVGKSSIEEVYNILGESDCFIGNDSMISHLASLRTLPIITISTGSVRPHETVPYRANCITITSETKCYPCNVSSSCEHLSCHKDITHNVVAQVCEGLMSNIVIDSNFIKNNVNLFHLNNIKIYKSNFTANCSFYLEELTDPELSAKDVIKLSNRIVFDLFLGNRDFKAGIPHLSNNTAHKLIEDLKIITQLYEVYNHGKTFAHRLLSAIENQSEDISALIGKIQDVEKLALSTRSYSSSVTVIADYFNTSLRNTQGESLKEIAENYLITFDNASNLVAMQFELIQQMVSPYIKPKGPETSV